MLTLHLWHVKAAAQRCLAIAVPRSPVLVHETFVVSVYYMYFITHAGSSG